MDTSQKHNQNAQINKTQASLSERVVQRFVAKDLNTSSSAVRGLQSLVILGALFTFVVNYLVGDWLGWLSTLIGAFIYVLLAYWVVRSLERRNGTARMVGFLIAIMFTLMGTVGMAVEWGNRLAVALSATQVVLGLAWFYVDSRKETRAHFIPEVK